MCRICIVCNTIDTNQVNILDHLDGMIIPFTNFQNFNYRIAWIRCAHTNNVEKSFTFNEFSGINTNESDVCSFFKHVLCSYGI